VILEILALPAAPLLVAVTEVAACLHPQEDRPARLAEPDNRLAAQVVAVAVFRRLRLVAVAVAVAAVARPTDPAPANQTALAERT